METGNQNSELGTNAPLLQHRLVQCSLVFTDIFRPSPSAPSALAAAPQVTEQWPLTSPMQPANALSSLDPATFPKIGHILLESQKIQLTRFCKGVSTSKTWSHSCLHFTFGCLRILEFCFQSNFGFLLCLCELFLLLEFLLQRRQRVLLLLHFSFQSIFGSFRAAGGTFRFIQFLLQTLLVKKSRRDANCQISEDMP